MNASVKRLLVAATIIAVPCASLIACGGSSDDSLGNDQVDGAADDANLIDSASTSDASDTGIYDGSRVDARVDASAPDAKIQNRCGGYDLLEFGGIFVTPGDSCGGCNDGTVVCAGSNTVECSGATAPPCPTPPVDAGPNACGGYGPLTFLSAAASLGAPCGECGGVIMCGTTSSLICGSQNYGPCDADGGLASTCTFPVSAYWAPTTSPTLPAETRPAVTSTASINLPSNGLIYNPYDGYLYASVSSIVPSQGNSIAVIDPTIPKVVTTIYVGPNPTTMALSDDGQVLWVYLSNSWQIRRVDLVARTAGLTFTLPTSSSVSALTVLPGTHDSLVVDAYEYASSYGGASTVIYDNGIPRPYGLNRESNVLATSSPSLILTPTDYDQIDGVCMDANGLFEQGNYTTFTGGNPNYDYSESMLFSSGTIYTLSGNAYDAKSGMLVNTFAVPLSSPYYYYDYMAADAQDVYYLTVTYHETNYWIEVTGFDRTTATATATDVLLTNANLTNSAFARWGRYGFAFLSSSIIEISLSTIIPDSP